jgi:Regulator of ribonuclease activity B
MKIKTVYLLFLCVVLLGCSGNEDATKEKNMTQAIPGKIITIDKLEDMFAAISEQSGWDMKKPMLWGYFFTHHEPKLLESAKGRLVENGYRFVDIHLSDKENPTDPDKWWLHVEKEEIHTPQSLDKRNDELYLLAHELGLDSYDGMDVGPIEK